MKAGKQMRLSEAALRLQVTYHVVRDLLFRGQLKGGRDQSGRWYVDRADVERVAAARAQKRKAVVAR